MNYQILKKWSDILEKNRLLCDFYFFYTPRRLVLWHREFQVKQEDSVVEQFGAPLKIAYKDGVNQQVLLLVLQKNVV